MADTALIAKAITIYPRVGWPSCVVNIPLSSPEIRVDPALAAPALLVNYGLAPEGISGAAPQMGAADLACELVDFCTLYYLASSRLRLSYQYQARVRLSGGAT